MQGVQKGVWTVAASVDQQVSSWIDHISKESACLRAGRATGGVDGRGKRGRKSYADVAVRQLDRSTATFKQLVEHADARERVKADEDRRIRVCHQQAWWQGPSA